MTDTVTADYLGEISYTSAPDVLAYVALYPDEFGPIDDPERIPNDVATDVRGFLDDRELRTAQAWYQPRDENVCRCAAGMGGREHRPGPGCPGYGEEDV